MLAGTVKKDWVFQVCVLLGPSFGLMNASLIAQINQKVQHYKEMVSGMGEYKTLGENNRNGVLVQWVGHLQLTTVRLPPPRMAPRAHQK